MNGMASAAKKYAEHDMIQAHIVLPDFPELRTNMLRAFLRHGSDAATEPDVQEAVAVAVSLAQLGLDTHERVDGKNGSRRRQMTVLAGDYFSSRFYQLLAQTANVQSIGLLAQSIGEVNRIKMNLYMKAKRLLLTAEEYVRNTVDINTHLFLSFTAWMDGACRKSCPVVLRAVAECELIAHELTRTRPDNVKESWVFWYVLQHGTKEEIASMTAGRIDEKKLHSMLLKYDLVGKLSAMWDAKVRELQNLLRTMRMIGSDKLAEELSHLFEPLFSLGNTARVLEEI